MKKFLLSTVLVIFGIMTTVYSQPLCGGTFTDPAGANANYANNSDYTVTICPTNPGDLVTVTFTSFSIEANFDAIYVFNGNSITSPQIASTNPAGNVPGSLAGGFWGTTIPGPFTSTSVDGCLTFRFRSDGSGNNPGWVANVTCAPAPTCLKPTGLIVTSITTTTAVLGWTDNSGATSWEVIAVACGTATPSASTVGQVVTVNPYTIGGLAPQTCYNYYVKAVCSPTDSSQWAGPISFTTLNVPPTCGGQYIDNGGVAGSYANNSDTTTTICPTNAGDLVTVTFTSFSTETNWDALYVFDGNSITSPQIASTNAAANVPGGLAGGFWGSTIPEPFTSTSADGCLTFRFRSDGVVTYPGWVANVTCGQAPTCIKPTALTTSNISITSVSLGWTENNGATSWETLALPCGSAAPTTATTGQIVTTNPATVSGLNPGTCYDIYVKSICSSSDSSYWSFKKTITTLFPIPANDECANAIDVPVSINNCNTTAHGTINSSTASLPATTCVGTADDDVWFKFTATSSNTGISLSNITGSTTNLVYGVYTGSCGSLTQFYCNSNNSVGHYFNNLTVGETYFVRVYSFGNTPQTSSFDICVTKYSSCSESQSACGITNYTNTTGVASTGTIGCLSTTPNPTYFSIKIAQSGPVNLLLTQSLIGSSNPNLDVDYAAWGPFVSKDAACAAISAGQAPGIGVTVTTTTGCSYSAAATESLNIANATAGQFYIILITNYSNQVGYINLTQTNSGVAGAGSIDCSGIRLNAFIDTNNNGTKDIGEVNFPLGQFQYIINSDTDVHHISTPSGMYTIYDDFSSNAYNLSYVINPEFSAMYSSSATYSNVIVASGGSTTYDFPITSLLSYNDVGVTLVPLSSPRAGTTYRNKIVYTNNGNQDIAAGSLTFDKNAAVTITNISQTGTIATSNGFSYDFTDLSAFESRSIIITMSVPSIPTVSLGQLLTNTVSVTPATGDLLSSNNNSTLTQAITGSYDPNDKSESHGGKILFSSFSSNDYLYYTIRFENTGTAGALNVRVTDLLDDKLDENSLIMINASHTYSLDRVNKSLVWNFDNIQLPVSVANTDIGKGYINFKIKPISGYAVGDIIPNTASIYFDTNPPIITNTYTTEFVQTLNTQYYDFSNLFSLSPVPAKNVLTITTKQAIEINSISIYNTLGQLVQVITNPNETIDVSGLKTGSYFIKIVSEKGTAIGKFVKE